MEIPVGQLLGIKKIYQRNVDANLLNRDGSKFTTMLC